MFKSKVCWIEIHNVYIFYTDLYKRSLKKCRHEASTLYGSSKCLCVFEGAQAFFVFFLYLPAEFAPGKLLLVYMDDGLAIITLSSGACPDLPPWVLYEEERMDASVCGSV